jgi:hypothetical protein
LQPQFHTQQQHSQPGSVRQCRYFAKGVPCPFGIVCLFSHAPASSSVGAATVPQQPVHTHDGGNAAPPSQQDRQAMCNFAMKGEECHFLKKYGNCRFLHQVPQATVEGVNQGMVINGGGGGGNSGCAGNVRAAPAFGMQTHWPSYSYAYPFDMPSHGGGVPAPVPPAFPSFYGPMYPYDPMRAPMYPYDPMRAHMCGPQQEVLYRPPYAMMGSTIPSRA